MNPAKWLQTATSTTELTLFHSIRLAGLVWFGLVRSCFIKNAPRFAPLGAEKNANDGGPDILIIDDIMISCG